MAAQLEDKSQQFPEIAGYRLMRVLGEGGMSTVYLAQQQSLGRHVAIKVIRPDAVADEVGRRRFENEARTIARLEHPHIVRIHEVGHTKQGLAYYVMPVLPRGHVNKRKLTDDESRVRDILQALLGALGYAHSRGIVHRDVKAENVLFDEADRPMLTDFGIALRRGFGSRVTSAGLAVGSTAYMSPEQARGIDVDHRTDLYSLGVLAWEILTGALPYQTDDALSMALKHVQDPIPRLPSHLRQWQKFFDRALAKTPIERFTDAAEMLEAMHEVPHAEHQPMRVALARIRAWFGPKQIAAAVLLGAGAITAWMLLPEPEPPPLAAFSVEAPADEAPAATLAPGVVVPESGPDLSEAMLRPPPESDAQKFITAAEKQLKQGRLIAPAGNNAYDNLMTAWSADPSHAQLPDLNAKLVGLLANEALQQVRRGEDGPAADRISRVQRLAERDRSRSEPTLTKLRRDVGQELDKRMQEAEGNYDRDAARRVVASARTLNTDAGRIAALQTRAEKIPQPGDRVDSPVGALTLTQVGGSLVGIAQVPVTRAAYAEFVRATKRPESLCRERASPLRLLAPRTWQSPGFEQSDAQAVVCISWQDANAFASWQSQRSGQRLRLPSASEAQALSRGGSGKQVAEWVSDCGPAGCDRRLASGRTWRGATGSRPLDANRGYDDVGFRLVREL
jgi:tRNA A-37 threonylcarbamoyl transferase component Bud32